MKKSTIIIINVIVSALMTLLLFNTNSQSRHGYENAIMFVLWSCGILTIQLLVNLGIAIYFFVKKDNEKAKIFLLSMVMVFITYLISFFLISDWNNKLSLILTN